MPIDPSISLKVIQPNIPTPQAMQASAAKMQEDRLKQQQAQEQQAASVALRGALNSSLDKDGNINRETFTAMIKNTPAIDKLPDFLTYFDKVDEARAKARSESISAKQAQNDHIAAIATTAEDYLNKGLPLPIATHALLAGVAQAVNDGIITEQDAAGRLAGMDPEDPNSVKQMIAGMKASAAKAPKPGTPYTLNPGDVRFDENNKQVADNPPAQAKVETRSLDVQAADALAKGDTETYNRLLKVKKEMGQADDRPPRITVNAGAASATSDVKETVVGMKDGSLPPILPGRATKDYTALLAEAHRQGYDLAGAATDWMATQKHIATLNGNQQTRLMQNINQLPELLDSVDALAAKWKGGRFPALNRANLALAKNGVYGKEAATIANQLTTQIADVTADLGAVYMGGNSPTDEALRLSRTALSGDWDETVLKNMTAQARRNVQIRKNSINNTGVAGASPNNPYVAPPPSAPSGKFKILKVE